MRKHGFIVLAMTLAAAVIGGVLACKKRQY